MISTIGYEKSDLDDFVGTLQRAKVEILVDIRERAQSRRKGFSKTALSERLRQAGIDYIHYRELGDPKPGREAARNGDMALFRKIFKKVLESDAAQEALADIASMSANKSICLMCYERDYRECHRKIVSDRLDQYLGSKTRHLGVQSIEPISKHQRRVLHSRESAAA